MKNIHKIRGKQEFLFDDRELMFLGGGALLISLLIFVLGFLIGQDLQKQGVASPLENTTELPGTEFTPEETDIAAAPLVDSQPLKNPLDKKEPRLSSYQLLPDSETVVEVESPSKPKDASLEKPANVPQQEAKQNAKESPQGQAAVVASAPAPQEMAIAPELPNVPRSPNDVIRFGRQSFSAEDQPAFAGTIYSVQIASSTSIEDSQRLQQKLIAAGYEALLMTVDLREKGIWYRVRVGNLASRPEAERLKQDLLNNASQLVNGPYVIKVTE